MSIKPGVYDLFATFIPGLVYLYVINEYLKCFNQNYIDINQLDKIPNLILVVILAYVLGQIFNNITFYGWYNLFRRNPKDKEALEILKKQFPKETIDFLPQDSKMLFHVLLYYDFEVAQSIDRLRSNHILMRNISLCSFFYMILQVVKIFQNQCNQFITSYLLQFLFGLLLLIIALRSSMKYDRWFFRDVFKQSLNYGTNLHEILTQTRDRNRISGSKLDSSIHKDKSHKKNRKK